MHIELSVWIDYHIASFDSKLKYFHHSTPQGMLHSNKDEKTYILGHLALRSAKAVLLNVRIYSMIVELAIPAVTVS